MILKEYLAVGVDNREFIYFSSEINTERWFKEISYIYYNFQAL